MQRMVRAFAANFATPWCTCHPFLRAAASPCTTSGAIVSEATISGSFATNCPRQKVAVSNDSATLCNLSKFGCTSRVLTSRSNCVLNLLWFEEFDCCMFCFASSKKVLSLVGDDRELKSSSQRFA